MRERDAIARRSRGFPPRALRPGRRPHLVRPRASTRCIVGSTSAATTRVTCAPAAPSDVEALENEVLESGRDRQLLARARRRRAAGLRSRARGRKRDSHPRSHQMRRRIGRGNAVPVRIRSSSWRAPRLSGPSSIVESRSGRDRSGEPGRHHVTGGEERGNGLLFEPRQGVAEHRQRRRVEPLDIVDREQQSLTLRRGFAGP